MMVVDLRELRGALSQGGRMIAQGQREANLLPAVGRAIGQSVPTGPLSSTPVRPVGIDPPVPGWYDAIAFEAGQLAWGA